jgi:hypothetical protein
MVRTEIETNSSGNPILGRSGVVNIGKMVGGVVIGLTVAKAVPRFMPATLSPWVSVLAAGVTAWGASLAARKYLKDATWGDSVLLGGLAGAGFIGLGLLLPASIGQPLGLGETVPSARFNIPQNPVGQFLGPVSQTLRW